MDRGLAMYHAGLTAVEDELSVCGISIADLVDGDTDREDALLPMTDGITASGDDVAEWAAEYLETDGKPEHDEEPDREDGGY